MMASPSQWIWSRAKDLANLATTPLTISHYLELALPLRATHTLNARVERAHDETADTRTLTLRPGAGWRAHRPGQFVKVSVAIDGRVTTRTYSVSSSPDRKDGCITITVKAVPGGKMSRFLTRDVKPGDYMTLAPAEGAFVLPEGAPVRPLFVTAGSGITPVMSMIRTLAARNAMPDVAHVHYAPRAEDAIFGEELAQLARDHASYRFHLITTRDAAPHTKRFGRTTLDSLVPDWQERETWGCGPQGLLGALEESFASVGQTGGLHIERFRPKLAPTDPNASGGRVRFGKSNVERFANGHTSLLVAAEEAGVNAPHGCRMGICHSCDATLVSGCVRDLRTNRRIDEPGTRVQVCVCAAAGDVELAL